MIQNEEDIHSKEFQTEILSFGKVKLYKEEKLYKIFECINISIKRPPKYNCFLLEGKTIFKNIIIYFKFCRFLEYYKSL